MDAYSTANYHTMMNALHLDLSGLCGGGRSFQLDPSALALSGFHSPAPDLNSLHRHVEGRQARETMLPRQESLTRAHTHHSSLHAISPQRQTNHSSGTLPSCSAHDLWSVFLHIHRCNSQQMRRRQAARQSSFPVLPPSSVQHATASTWTPSLTCTPLTQTLLSKGSGTAPRASTLLE
ncbi:hypothetical protein AC579_6327 [Pseudocercospora musae]|uniref:Uncharacterized protein n=1 Tax=Pseudocercospora musae TaxID=113226 RepID=A0A139I1I6_9PEZI|nr:hypothetical protein AC579_6327 [Pseudocercospora musae]